MSSVDEDDVVSSVDVSVDDCFAEKIAADVGVEDEWF